jgi:SAM-dependent methyltransferase
MSSFDRIVGIDVSARMLDFYPVGGRVRAIKAAIETHPKVLQELRPDVITCLAGVHHVYELDDGIVDDETSDAIQADLLVEWARSLSPGGCMIVADITDPRDNVSFSNDDRTLAAHNEALSRALENVRRAVGQYLSLSDGYPSRQPSSILQHVHSVLDAAPDANRAQPALWFREVVAKYGVYGHTDHFLKARRIEERLRSEGFDARYYELPTPWVFPSEDDFVYFFHEKFALGPPARHVDEIAASTRALIANEAHRLLGLTMGRNGHVFSGWRLGYYVVTRRDEATHVRG